MAILDRLKFYALEHWLILPLFISGVFASGFHAISVVTVLYFPLLHYYSRKQWTNVILATLVNLISFWISTLGLSDTEYGEGKFQHPEWAFVGAIGAAINTLIALTGDKLASSHPSVALRVFTFPLLFAGTWWGLFGRLLGFGDSMSYSSSVVYGFSDIVQAATWLGGRPMIDFVMTLFATVVQEYNASTYKPIFDDDGEEEETHHSNRRYPWLFHPATWYAAFITLLAIFGGVQNGIYHGSFFQVGYPEFVPKTIPIGCVLGPGGIDMPLQTDYDRWLEYSGSLADAGAKLIMWSEEVAATDGFKEEAMLINKAQSLARDKDVYLVITYDRTTPPNVAENKLVLITPQGDVAINYSKSHPVPIIEPITAGKQELPYIDTPEFGRVGAAICYDYTFPWFIRQASDKNIDVMLQASWTWGPLGTYHSKSSSLRPVENGFTLVRCASQGVSGIYEPTLNGIFSQHVAGVSDSAYLFHLPIRRRWRTFYGFTGDAVGVWCVCIGVLVLVSLLQQHFRRRSHPFLR